MTPCFAAEFETPKHVSLNGLWFGPVNARRAIVWVHGLGSSVFSKHALFKELIDRETAVFVWNTRGHDVISKIRAKGKRRVLGGSAHEVFTECVDDIDGAIRFAKRQGAKEIFLAGHSTGCQKSAYWAHKRKGKGVKGIILLAPVSDYAGEMHLHGGKKIVRAAKAARALVAAKKPHALLSAHLWHETLDAQRFLSLYTPDSIEEIFSYAQPAKRPRVLQSAAAKPVLVLWAERDEFADRPAAEAAAWFQQTLSGKRHEVRIVAGAGHGFGESEEEVGDAMLAFMKRCSS
jgi:alpha-beta hydrolase superfamily lysophospholipase